MSDVALELEGLVRHYGDVRAVDGVHLTVSAGERFSLLGPSGSGKTTILRLVAGFEAPDAGSVSLAREAVDHLPPEKRNVGVVFQDYALFPHRTVRQNIGFGLRMRKVAKIERRERVDELLELVGLQREADRKPHQLSGGQRQRVALARALAPSPGLLLLDEPLANLDRRLRESLREELVRITSAVGITSVLVTHDQEEALSFANRVGVLREGRLVQVGTPVELWQRPVDAFVATFLGDMNLLPVEATENGRVSVSGIAGALDRLPGDATESRSEGGVTGGGTAGPADAVACLRPEALRLEPSGEATVRSVFYAGGTATYSVEAAGRRITVREQQPDGQARIAEGDAVTVTARVSAVRLLPGTTA
ncbi:ABC transporter ATP-binding protein [Euzebya tangerina]|uniref:ABC transporter ATP-binding protein n=1 Tax=Euzebya tangerina TaxID=591198 RepID=UPI000E31C8C7|nr:ABC transporter ATP-binding protein [Euzebya tangerina]